MQRFDDAIDAHPWGQGVWIYTPVAQNALQGWLHLHVCVERSTSEDEHKSDSWLVIVISWGILLTFWPMI